MDGFSDFDAHWVWLTLGVVLAGLEMLVPGVYLIWLAIAAIITGLLTMVLDLSLLMQVVDFVFLALIAVFSARRYLNDSPIESVDPMLNHPGSRMIGETAQVTQAIDHGTGRVKLGDSEWIARGPDMEVGARARIIGAQGIVLMVEPFTALPAEDSDTQG
ncbi:NfeD family protein [Altericroceibacterium endophyticum]|uniref:NfeD family protein n=1 Tax=Altericroceibacterium endophyticum TaxID=1808508 RepID=A0A6I4T367_9SPHN|nr:NfeD family protein [Altericroceibacterium endophyticum]MXO65367.1 NfeD family protein [Altericroceibacterium endophyticum]